MNILVTGAGASAAVGLVQALSDTGAKFFMADIDHQAAGLYLVPATQRTLVLPGMQTDFVWDLLQQCRDRKIDVLAPTLDVELVAIAKARKQFEQIGVQVLLASAETLELCLDRLKLLIACDGFVNTPRFAVFNESFDDSEWQYPLLIKPRNGSKAIQPVIINTPVGLRELKRSDHLLVEEYLPGEEFMVDVFANKEGEVLATVPHQRIKVNAGVTTISRTIKNEVLAECARNVAKRIGLNYVAHMQFRNDAQGRLCLVNVKPRFAETIQLRVASGVNIPFLCLKELLQLNINQEELEWRELAMVRTWNETYVDAAEIKQINHH